MKELLAEIQNKDLTKSSPMYQEAVALFVSGKLDAAIACLADDKLIAREKALQQEQKQQAETRILKGRMLGLKFQFDEAANQFERARAIYPSWKTDQAAGVFHQELHHFDEAGVLYRSALNRAGSQEEKAATLHNLGNLQYTLQDYDGAKRNYEEALAIRRGLAAQSPEAYQSYVAGTLNNLALLQSKIQDYDGAKRNYEEALGMYRGLAAQSPEAYQYYVAMTLSNLGKLQYTLQEYAGAITSIKESQHLYQTLALRLI